MHCLDRFFRCHVTKAQILLLDECWRGPDPVSYGWPLDSTTSLVPVCCGSFPILSFLQTTSSFRSHMRNEETELFDLLDFSQHSNSFILFVLKRMHCLLVPFHPPFLWPITVKRGRAWPRHAAPPSRLGVRPPFVFPIPNDSLGDAGCHLFLFRYTEYSVTFL